MLFSNPNGVDDANYRCDVRSCSATLKVCFSRLHVFRIESLIADIVVDELVGSVCRVEGDLDLKADMEVHLPIDTSLEWKMLAWKAT